MLKEKNNNNGKDGCLDPYEEALRKAGYSAHFLPVLSHRLVNLDAIQDVLSRGKGGTAAGVSNSHGSSSFSNDSLQAFPYSGVVFTSQRAVEAWATAGQAILDSSGSIPPAWTKLPFYAVGPATASALQRLDARLRPPASRILGAEESGSAVRLASYVISLRASTSPSSSSSSTSSSLPSLPLLYLAGDKRKDTLSSLLKEGDISMHEIEAYETFQSPTFEADYAKLQECEPFEWIVFFSPSGTKLLLPLLPRDEVDVSPRFAAIGPTTRDYLLSQNGVDVSAMAESPNPDSLVSAMLAADER